MKMVLYRMRFEIKACGSLRHAMSLFFTLSSHTEVVILKRIWWLKGYVCKERGLKLDYVTNLCTLLLNLALLSTS